MTPETTIPKLPIRLDEGASALVNAYQLARVARAVYSTQLDASLPVVQATFPELTTFAHGRVFGIVAGNESDVLLAFRGTDENREWLAAFACGQVAWDKGRVHEGLAEALENVWRPVMAAFYDVGALDKRVWVAGHSLGGALATLAAFRLSCEGLEPHFVATFGSPRVMDAVAAAAFSPTLHRVVNNEDAVPDFPWPTLLDTYVHVGERMFLLPSGGLAAARHSPHLARRLDRADTIGAPSPRAGFIHDHLMVNYVAKLEHLAS